MAQELIDWRDLQYMEKLNAYVNKTGLDPRTGLEASDDLKFVAKHYGWVKGSSTLAASLISAKIDFDEMMVANHTGNKNYRSQDDLLGSFEDFMSPEDAKRYADWNDFVEAGIEPEARLRIMDEGIFSPKTYVEFSAANPTQNVDDYIELVRGQSPWPKGYTPKKVVLNDSPISLLKFTINPSSSCLLRRQDGCRRAFPPITHLLACGLRQWRS